MNVRTAIVVTVALLAGLSAAFAGIPRHDFPLVGKFQVLSGDFHVHTAYSDGGLKVRERIEEAHGLGYDAIAITDHGTTRGCAEALEAGKALGMVVVPGFETGTSGPGGGEHLVVLGVPPNYHVRDGHAMSLSRDDGRVFYQDELKKIAAVGGIVFYAHPNYGPRADSGVFEAAGGSLRITSHLLPEPVVWGIQQGQIVGVEVQNGWGNEDFGWGIAKFRDVWCYPHGFDWALQKNLAIFADTDIHGKNSHPTQPVTLVFAGRKDVAGVIEAIKARRTAAWFNGMIWGREKLLSDLLTASVTAKRSPDKHVLLENRCPVALSCALAASPEKVVELGPYRSAVTDWKPANSLRVTWTNVWTSPKTNLETTVKVK